MQVTFSIKFTLTSAYACSYQTIMLKIRAAAGSQCHFKFFSKVVSTTMRMVIMIIWIIIIIMDVITIYPFPVSVGL